VESVLVARENRSEVKSGAKAGEADGATLADRLRAVLPAKDLSEQKMFGGVGFMLKGNMIAGASKRGLLLRVGKERYRDALARTGVRPMEMRGRPVEGYVRVDAASLSDMALRDWINLARAFVKTLPPKASKRSPSRRKET
jgi:TfoX/Sxy family transcriptional regulator of competence genes